MGTGSSVVQPEVDDGERRQVTLDRHNNNIPKGAQGNGVSASYSLQVNALLTSDYQTFKPIVVPRRAISFQVRGSEPISASTRQKKYRAPLPPTTVAPFKLSDTVKLVAVASVGEVKVGGSPVGKRYDTFGHVNIPKITIPNKDSAMSEAFAMTDNYIRESVPASMAGHASNSPRPIPIPSPRLTKAESLNRPSPNGSPRSDRVVRRRNTDVTLNSNARLARSQPLPKMRQNVLSPPISNGEGHIKQLSDSYLDHNSVSASEKPFIHPRQHSDPHSTQDLENHTNHQLGNHFEHQRELIRNNFLQKHDGKNNNYSDHEDVTKSETHSLALSVAIESTSVEAGKRTKPTPKPRAIRPTSFNLGLKVDHPVPSKSNRLQQELVDDMTFENSPEAHETVAGLRKRQPNKCRRNKLSLRSNSEENSEGYYSAVSSQVEDGVEEHDDDDDIIVAPDNVQEIKKRNTQVTPVKSALSPTSPVYPGHVSPYFKGLFTRISTVSSNDSLDSVEEFPFGLSYGSYGTHTADDERSDTLGDSGSLDLLLSSSDSIAIQTDEAVQLRKKPNINSEQALMNRMHRKLGKSMSDNPRLAASCEALHDNVLLQSSLPEETLHRLRVLKSKSMLDVPERGNSPLSDASGNSSPRSTNSGSPSLDRRFGLDPKKFVSKFPRMSSSPSLRRRTEPINDPDGSPTIEARKRTPIELFANSPLNPDRPAPPDYETTLHNVVEGKARVDSERERERRRQRRSLQPSDYRKEAWLSGPEVRVKRPSISTAFDHDVNLEGLNLMSLSETFPSGKRGKKYHTLNDFRGSISPRYSRKSKGLNISLMRKKDNRQVDVTVKPKDTSSLFPSEGFTLTLPDVCFVIDLDKAVEENSFDVDFEVQRIPEYDKYLQELRAETTQTHPDYEELTKTTQRVSNMVKEREEEMNNAENEYKVDNVQDRFPNDDLQLNEKEKSNQRYRALQTRRRSAPSAVLIKNIGVKNRGAPNINSRPLPFASDDLPSRPHNSNRTYLLEGPVQLSVAMQPLQDRYLFLFNDILLIAKKKSATTFKLKSRVRVCELWLTKSFLDDVTEASTSTCPPEKSFVIGWPTMNMVATFGTADLKDLWCSKLTDQISEEKSRELPKTVSLRILNKEMPGYASSKNITVMKTEEANDVIKTCLEQFEISDAKPEDYQIWVRSGKEGTMTASPYPLFGHEHPYSIKMSHVRDAAKATGNVILPQDTELGSDTLPPEHQCQFIIKHKSKPHMLNIANKKNKKSPIANLFRRSVSRRDIDFDSVDTGIEGKLFGQRLADVCEDDVFPKPVMDMLTRLYHEGPSMTGIFRKSASKRLCENLKALFDEEKEYNIDDWQVPVIGDTLKLFFREMPDSIFGGDVYEKFVVTHEIQDHEERVEEVRRMIESLPKCNQNLLRHFICVLHRIDENNTENNMNAFNLSVCVGPSILRNPATSVDGKDPLCQEQMKKETACVQFVIENFVELFGEDSQKIFGDPKTTMRQDSGTDSDSMHSILSMQESTGGLRRDDSSLDSLDRELYHEMDSSPQLAKSHLSPTNLSRDSGLTLSDTQLYEESGESENSNNSGGRPGHPEFVFSREDQPMPVPPPRSKRRRGSEPQTSMDAARVLARMCAVPGNGALASGMGMEKTRGSLCTSMSGDVFKTLRHGGQLQTKKLSIESLRSVEENSESEFNPNFERFMSSGDIGVLRKSSSGAKLFFDEDMVMTHRPGEAVPSVAQSSLTVSCDNRRSSTEYSSQDSEPSTPGSPKLYSRVWVADAARSSKPGSLSASYGGSTTSHQFQNSLNPNYVPQLSMASANKLSAPMPSQTRSAPSTPNESSPSSSPRGSFSKYLSKDSADSSPCASSTDLLSNESDGESPPAVPYKPPSLSLSSSTPVAKSGKYSDTVGCGSPPPEVILRNQLYKGQQGPEQIFDFDSPKAFGVDRSRLANDAVSSCSSDDDDRPTRSFTSSLSSLNSAGSQEKTDKVNTAMATKVAKKNYFQKTFVEKSSSDTNVLKQFHKSSGALGGRPDRPPSYQEAIHRKILLKSGNGTTQAVTYTDEDVVEQSANSANARKLYEESLKKYNQLQACEGSPNSSPSKHGLESRAGFPKLSIGSAITEEPSTPPKSPATVKRSQSDTDKMKDLKQQHYKNSRPMFYTPSAVKDKKTTVKDNEKVKPEPYRQQPGIRTLTTRYSDCTPMKEDKNASTVQYYKTLVKTAPEKPTLRRNPPPYRHPPPIQCQVNASVNKGTVSQEQEDDKPKLRRQGSGPRPVVDLETLVCTEESLV